MAAGILITGGLVFGLSPQPQSLKVYYGLMHAHTLISDGSGTPEEAYQMAETADLDFFAVTEHNHAQAESGAKERKDGVLIATNTSLYNGTGKQNVTRVLKTGNETISITPLIEAARAATSTTFLALYGQEFSTISSGNHVNVIGVNEVLTSPNGDFRALLDELKQSATTPLLQFNHPDVAVDLFYNGSNASTQNNMFNDYGIDEGDLGPDFRSMVAALDPYVELIEVLSGPAMKEEPQVNFRYNQNENDYYFYLKQGFHLGPSVGQDNHYRTWGTVTDARLGVMANALTEAEITMAIRNHRTFATEDKNLKVVLYVNNQMMGSSLTVGEESELKINIELLDPDDADLTTQVTLYGGEISPELSTKAKNWKASDGELETIEVDQNGTFTLNGFFATSKPYFVYAKIVQADNDRAWTSPIWINDPYSPPVAASTGTQATLYYWTKTTSSTVYHSEGCPSVERIKPENLQSGATPPAGRSRHSCPVIEDINH